MCSRPRRTRPSEEECSSLCLTPSPITDRWPSSGVTRGSICQGRPGAGEVRGSAGKGTFRGPPQAGAKAEKPRVSPGLRTGPCCPWEAEREVLAQRRPPTRLPASPQLCWAFRGHRGPCVWRGPAWKGRGPGSRSRVFQAGAGAKFGSLGSVGREVQGTDREVVHSLSRKKGLVTGEGAWPGWMPVTQALP